MGIITGFYSRSADRNTFRGVASGELKHPRGSDVVLVKYRSTLVIT